MDRVNQTHADEGRKQSTLPCIQSALGRDTGHGTRDVRWVMEGSPHPGGLA